MRAACAIVTVLSACGDGIHPAIEPDAFACTTVAPESMVGLLLRSDAISTVRFEEPPSAFADDCVTSRNPVNYTYRRTGECTAALTLTAGGDNAPPSTMAVELVFTSEIAGRCSSAQPCEFRLTRCH